MRIKDSTTFNLLEEIIASYSTIANQKIGMPIGNLTSQIFANIYLNELDHFVKHRLKPKAYLRYGDDFIVIESNLEKLNLSRVKIVNFLKNELRLETNPKSDKIIKFRHGLRYLGVKLWSKGRTLTRRNFSRTKERLNMKNSASYSGLTKQHGNFKQIKQFNWLVYEKLLADL